MKRTNSKKMERRKKEKNVKKNSNKESQSQVPKGTKPTNQKKQ